MVSSVLLKEASFAFVMDVNRWKPWNMELYFSAGAKFKSSDWPWQTVFGENIYS